MPSKSRRRRKNPQDAAGINQDVRPKQNPRKSQQQYRQRASWLNRNKSTVRVYGIVGVVLLGIGALIALGVQQSLGSDFEFSMYQGDIGVPQQNAKYSEIFPSEKPVVFNFWAGRCPPCRAEMPAFQRVYDRFKDDVLLFGLDVGPFMSLGSNDDARRLLRELGITYPTGYAHDRSPVRQRNITSMPTTLFMTSDGKIKRKWVGLLQEDQMIDMVEELLEDL